MKLKFCAACGDRDVACLEHHHLVPLSDGGSDDETNLITLCCGCHGVIHNMRRPYDIGLRIRTGVAKAKRNGIKFGRKLKLTPEQRQEAIKRRAAGETLTSIAKSYAVDGSMISRL